MTVRAMLSGITPPLLIDTYRRLSGKALRFVDHSGSWEEAAHQSTGYAKADILERVKHATRAVASGTAPGERDSVLLAEAVFPFAVLSTLWRAAASSDRHLDVVDIGGSLGSTYRQCRTFLTGLSHLRWVVVEQPAFVAAGRREFTTGELLFSDSLAELPAPSGCRVIIASSVLQYVAELDVMLADLANVQARYLVIDRTPMSEVAEDHLCIQHVPKHIYRASYPCRILSRSGLIARLQSSWELLCNFPCAEGERRTDKGMAFSYRGLIFERRL